MTENAALPTIVGIGASAGGLAALEELFSAAPEDCDMAFVVVMHLDATQKSLLTELLSRRTDLPVEQLTQETRVKPGHLYVAPPGHLVSMEGGMLQLAPTSESTPHGLPIDAFFKSLASDQGPNAVGVILSGTGTDGTLGIRAIKAEQGMVIAQDESAAYSGMPHSAIETGLVDFVLAPKAIAACLLRCRGQAAGLAKWALEDGDARPSPWLRETLSILRARTGHDFSQYKTTTILRRIQRRIDLHQLRGFNDYLRYLTDNHDESVLLFRELLIGVTGFFRDPEAFAALQAAVAQRLDADRGDSPSIRIWVPGCSTGEEAYSVAIVAHECGEALQRYLSVQVFATDIDDHAIAIGRSGLYPAGIRSDVSAERLKRFFNAEEDGRFRVNKTLRESLVFAAQNVTRDPPFSKLDLICCRNLLIYFSTPLQRQTLALFHYALNPDGLLLLGSSESIEAQSTSFRPLDRKWKLFSRLPGSPPRSTMSRMLAPDGLHGGSMPDAHAFAAERKQDSTLVHLLQGVLRETNTPPCAVVDPSLNTVFVHGRTGRYLEPAEGAQNSNILEMARPGLREELATCIARAARERVEVRRERILVDSNGSSTFVNITAKPFSTVKSLASFTLVIFHHAETSQGRDAAVPCVNAQPPPPPGTLEDLRQKLERCRENHQVTVEELETANEELQSTNEELQSANEELQSTNEELGTSKEELQSLNEEAATVNAELQGRIEELSRANDDLKNLLDGTNIATLFLDANLRVRRFTPACAKLIPLAPNDLGRSVTHFATALENVDLGAVATAVLDDLVVRELEVETRDGGTYLLRVRPYRTTQNVIDGAVLTFDDRTGVARERSSMQQRMEDTAATLVSTQNQLDAAEARDKPGPDAAARDDE